MLRERERQRLESIFQALSQGKKADEIDALLKEAESKRKVALGFQSEERVERILCSLPFVTTVHSVRHQSQADVKGKDLIVYLDERELTSFEKVNVVSVQVKSSQTGIESYRTNFRSKLHLSRQELDDYFKEKKLILINGKNGRRMIEESFNSQLYNIRQFHSEKYVSEVPVIIK